MLTDNMSAKTWVEKKRCSSQFANAAWLLYIWTILLTGYVIVEVQHIPGASAQMQPIDDLSRNRIPTGTILHFESKSIVNFSIKCSQYAA